MLVVDSVTELGPHARNEIVVCGSHGGAFSGRYAVACGVRAIVLHDAGVGKDAAGIAGLGILDDATIPSATVATSTAIIGDGRDTLSYGVISHVNRRAAALGCSPGQPAKDALATLERAPANWSLAVPPAEETRHLIRSDGVAVWALDSVSDVKGLPEDALLFTGSHANLLGGRPETALRGRAGLAVYNDAGVSARAGLTRLPELDLRGIPAAAVSSDTARIGDGRSTYSDGVVSAVNQTAHALGARSGIPASDLVNLLVVHAR